MIISHGFAPWGGPAALRAVKLAKNALKSGFKVTVLAASENCAHVFDDPGLLEEVVGVKMVRVSDGTDYRFREHINWWFGYSAVRITDKIFAKSRKTWVGECTEVLAGYDGGMRPDVIYCTPPFWEISGVAQNLASLWNVPYILDFRDPPWEIGMPAELLEGFLRDSCLSVFNTPPAACVVKAMYPEYASKIECWTNGTEPPPVSLKIHRWDRDRPVTLIFPGGIYPWVADAIEVLQPFILDRRLVVNVYGFIETKRRREINRLRKYGAIIHKPVPSKQIDKLMSEHCANLVTLPPDHQISSKVYLMIASGRPVITFGQSKSASEILDSLPGIFNFDTTSSNEEINMMLCLIKEYDPLTGWPARLDWLKSRTWPAIFEGIFGRFYDVA